MYIARNLSKFAEEDVFEDGCQPGTGQMFDLDVSFTGDTPEAVIEKIADFLGVDPKDAEKNVCDEPGRVEFGITENGEGYALSKRESEKWQAGKIKAWYAVYTAYIEKCEPVKL